MLGAISQSALQRLPQYLIMLKEVQRNGTDIVSPDQIGEVVKVSSSQVRHDLASCGLEAQESVCAVKDMIAGIEHVLGYDDISNAVIVGAGQLGRALLSYQNYRDYGVDVIAAFDSNEEITGQEIGGKPILSIRKMASLCRRMKVHIGIITVPAKCAQEVCDKLIDGGIQAIWNFAPVHLRVPDYVLVKNEIIAVSLGELSRQLQEKRENISEQFDMGADRCPEAADTEP